MNELPFHPVIVHLPLGLSAVMPAVALILLVAIWRKWLPPGSWWLAVALQAVLSGGAWFAMEAGEDEEDRVERLVPHDAFEEHEEKAEVFFKASAATAALMAVAGLLASRRAGPALMGASIIASAAVLVLALQTGHSGGELVYRHGAAGAGVAVPQAPRAPGRK